MIGRNYYLFYFFSILSNFIVGSVARKTIFGGHRAIISPFSYQVSLLFDGHGHDCGGGIIGDKHILTTAHCVVEYNGEIDPTPITILAGTDNLYRTGPSAVKVNVTKIYVPMEYKAMNLHTTGDIAVLKLQRPGLSQHKHLKRLSLPSKYHDDIYVGKTAKIAGFGWDWVQVDNTGREYGSNSEGHLRFAEAFVISRGQKGYYKETVPEKQICARIKQHDPNRPRGTCTQDSGGPLVYAGKTVIGILSISPSGCLESEVGAVYTRVSYYLDFIKDALRDNHRNDTRTHSLVGFV